MADPDNLFYTAGNVIHIFNVPKSEVSFRRTALGGGIGNIRTNPNAELKHIAVAENGNNFGAKPLVVIYEWPTLEIVCVLKGGSTASFTNLDYSPDGSLLVSQAGEPDYLITIYDWPRHTILLRTKSYVNDVYRVKFSEKVPGQLCSAGVAHIKFWKMCNTFTGLKLKGEVGRFGKTEYTDILGIQPMPDEKRLNVPHSWFEIHHSKLHDNQVWVILKFYAESNNKNHIVDGNPLFSQGTRDFMP
ncbi:hypothetical protein HHI36_011382 [Cryptolaemus montrouzieri]|uniref:Uncharacterized protein n=1 Tax=Cryptolaemus montrouzieri TaxID=559131 RepID=A0ABD2MLJ0_9CUCU